MTTPTYEERLIQLYEIVKAYIAGEHIPHEEHHIARSLRELRDQKNKDFIFESKNNGLPILHVGFGEGCGVKIKCEYPKEFNCAEYTLSTRMQTVMETPWVQFAPAELGDFYAKTAMEVARRASAYDALLDKVKSLEHNQRGWAKTVDARDTDLTKIRQAWANERVKYGLKDDFSDYHDDDWPKD